VNKTKQPEPSASLSSFALGLQPLLIPVLESCAPDFDWIHIDVLMVLEVLQVELVIAPPRSGQGRPTEDRRCLFRAFVAKAVLNLATTEALISRLRSDEALARCIGYRNRAVIPSASTFSRAFAHFALLNLAESVHEAVAERFLSSTFAITVSRDSTAIEVREKAVAKQKRPKPEKKKPGRKPKGSPPRDMTRVERQIGQSWQEAEAELPKQCDTGVKHNSKGRAQYWDGYKLHVDVTEDGFPLAALTTSASVHDTQAAVPLSKKSNERCFGCYKLMDKAYWSKPIIQFEMGQGSVPIVPGKVTRAGDPLPLDPDRQERFKDRTVVERFNSRLKDNLGGRFVRVRGHAKVHLHLMMGVLACAALVILRC
jgi:hypothetical protein